MDQGAVFIILKWTSEFKRSGLYTPINNTSKKNKPDDDNENDERGKLLLTI